MAADIHLGTGSRLHDILWSMRTIKEYAVKHDIDTIVVLGDLYHDRDSLSIDVLCESFDFFREARKAGQQWIAFPGNHDMFLKHSWKYSSLEPLRDLITVIDDVKLLKLDDRRFWILPFIYSESAYMRVVSRINERYEEDDVLLTHIGVKTAIQNICFLLQSWSVVDFSKTKFDQVFSGHFHIQQNLDNLWYVGSIIPFKFDEGDVSHGFIEYDLDDRTFEFVDIWKAGKEVGIDGSPPPQYKTFYDELIEEKTEKDVNNCIIRIAITRDYSPNEKNEIRQKFLDMGARKITFFDIIDKEINIEKITHYTVPASRLFLKWLKQDEDNLASYNKGLLKKLNCEIMQEGDEIYQKSKLDD